MGNPSKNVFNEGWKTDLHPATQSSKSARKLENFTIVTKEGKSLILTNRKGNELYASLPVNYVVLASTEYKNVCYMVIAEVLSGATTGKVELGSFPAPDPNSNFLIDAYRSFSNYAGDNNEFPSKDGPFNSSLFGLGLTNPVDMEIQQDYDGTVNLIIVDGENPNRIVNSRFSVLPGRKYEIVERNGEVDSNKYDKSSFDNILNLVAKSRKIANLNFLGSINGGQLKGGNYHYYFAYATAEGDETPIIAESFTCPVFNGETISNIHGDDGTAKATNKMNKFEISHLDRSYQYLIMYFTHSFGINGLIRSTYKVDAQYQITSNTMNITHTGFETIIQVPDSAVQLQESTIETAKTVAQVDGHLMLGNVREKNRDTASLRKFASKIFTHHTNEQIDIIGTEEDMLRIYDEQLNQEDKVVGTTGWNGGYYNPMNVYHKLGYWKGESYPYAAAYIYPDGTRSPLFPVFGVDNLTNSKTSNYGSIITDSEIEALVDGENINVSDSMKNTKGIYRFPRRKAEVGNKVASYSKITTQGVTFKIPSLDVDLGGGKTIKDFAIGIQFFRGERKRDAIAQGHLIDVAMIPDIDYRNIDSQDSQLFDYNGSDYNSSNHKLIPSYDFILECDHRKDADGDRRASGVRARGLIPIKLNIRNRDPREVLDQSMFAMICPDAIVDPSRFSDIFNQEYGISLIAKGTFRNDAPTVRDHTNLSDEDLYPKDHFSVAKQYTESSNYIGQVKGKLSWVIGESKTYNDDRFSSAAFFQARVGPGHDDGFAMFDLLFNDYIGVNIAISQLNDLAGVPAPIEDRAGQVTNDLYGKTGDKSFIVNIYPNNSGPRSAQAVSEVYRNIDTINYFPISKRMYFDTSIEGADDTNTLEGSIDGNRRLTCFNGDAYIGLTFRKLFNSGSFREEDQAEGDIIRTGYHIAVLTENNYNTAFRANAFADLNEFNKRSFAPFYAQGLSLGDRNGVGSNWREYKLKESSFFSNGYNPSLSLKNNVVLTLNAPAFNTRWFARIWASAKHIPNSYSNGFRNMISYRDFDTNLGEIVRLVSNFGNLYCIQERGIGIVPVNERIQTGEDSAGAVFLKSEGVLGTKMGVISNSFGAEYFHSIIATEMGIYGQSLSRKRYWKVNDSIVLLSSSKIESELKARMNLDQSFDLLKKNLVTSFDPDNGEVIFTLLNSDNNFDDSFSIAFNEFHGEFAGEIKNFIPYHSFNIDSQMYAFNSNSNNHKIWKQNSDVADRGNFFGVQGKQVLSFIVNENSDLEKVFDNLVITGNRVLPKVIRFYVPSGNTEMTVDGGTNRITANTRFNAGNVFVIIPKIQNITDEGIDENILAARANAKAYFASKSRMRGRYLLVELEYEERDLLEIESTTIDYKLRPH